MPFITKPFSEDEEDKLNNQLSSTSVGLTPQASPAPVGKGTQKASGSFTNLEKYINANKDQSQQLATAVADKVTSAGDEARSSFTDANSSFKNTVNQNTISGLDTGFTDAKSTVDKTVLGSYANDQDLNRFKEVTNARYKGPENLEQSDYYFNAQSKNQKVNDYSNLSDSEAGRGQLLNDIYKRPNYTAGQNTFDNLLLNGNEVNKQKIQSARQSVSDIDSSFQNLLKQASEYAAQIKDKTDAVRNDSVNYFTNQQSSENTKVDDRIGSVKSDWNNDYNYFRNLLNSSDGGKNLALSQDEFTKLGVKEQQRLYNVLKDTDASAYLKQNTFEANRNVTRDEQAKLAALDMLAKQFDGNLLNKYTNAEIAGTQSINDALDASGFGKEIDVRNTLFDEYAKNQNYTGRAILSEQITNRGPAYRVVNADATGSQNLKDYTLGNTPSINVGASVDGPAGDYEAELQRARATVEAQARADLFSQINNALNAQGYFNQAKGKK